MKRLILLIAAICAGSVEAQTINGQSVRLQNVPPNSIANYCKSSTGSDTFTCSVNSSTRFAYADGIQVLFQPTGAACSGAATINMSSKGARKLFAADGSSDPECAQNRRYWIAYDSALDSGTGAWVMPAAASGGSGIASLVEDTSPQLGGDLDLNGHVVTGLVIGTNVQAYDADLTTYAGITPSANVQSYLGAADYSAMRTLLGLVIGTNVQAYDADLTTYAGITPSSNVQSYLGAADYAAMRTLLGLVIGTNVQAYDADLNTYAGITPSANVQSLLGAANYAAMKTLLDTDDIQTLTGIAAGTAHLGTFTGTTIADSQTIKAALQALETALEAVEVGGFDATTLDDVTWSDGGQATITHTFNVSGTTDCTVIYGDGVETHNCEIVNSGTPAAMLLTAVTSPSAPGSANQWYFYQDSADGLVKYISNGGSEQTFTRTIASGTKALDTDAISSEACDTMTATATGAASTDSVFWTPNADISGVTGYVPETTGGLAIYLWPTTDTLNIKVCNPSGGSITPGAVSLNWRIVR